MGKAHCDFLGVTVANEDWPAVKQGIQGPLDVLGAALEFDADNASLWRTSDRGTVKAQRYGPVTSISASGAVLAGLRAFKVMGAYLAALGAVPHRVTRLDAAHDRPEPTAPVLVRLVEKAHTEAGLSLTRKRILPRHVTRLVTRGVDGLDTGTCYLGSRSAEVRACVYDKRQERLDRGLPDVGPLTRYELRLKSKVGATLRDAADPTSLFWHFMAPDVLDRPEGVEPWEAQGEGFSIDWPELPLPAARLRRRLENSPDVRALLRLANESGPGGFDFLVSELKKLHDQRVWERVWAEPTQTANRAAPRSH